MSEQDARLRSIVERIEHCLEERKGINIDITEIYLEAKGHGFDASTIRQVIKRRAMSKQERDEQDELLEIYERAVGQLAGDAARGSREAPARHMMQVKNLGDKHAYAKLYDRRNGHLIRTLVIPKGSGFFFDVDDQFNIVFAPPTEEDVEPK